MVLKDNGPKPLPKELPYIEPKYPKKEFKPWKVWLLLFLILGIIVGGYLLQEKYIEPISTDIINETFTNGTIEGTMRLVDYQTQTGNIIVYDPETYQIIERKCLNTDNAG